MLDYLEKFSRSDLPTCRRWATIVILGKRIGELRSEHKLRGHFLEAEIRISFDGSDPTAASGLRDPVIWRALAFRGEIRMRWTDLPPETEMLHACDSELALSYQSSVPGDETDLGHVEAAAELDLGAIDALVGSLVKAGFWPAATAGG